MSIHFVTQTDQVVIIPTVVILRSECEECDAQHINTQFAWLFWAIVIVHPH